MSICIEVVSFNFDAKILSQSCLCTFSVLISLHVLSFLNKIFLLHHRLWLYSIGPETNGHPYISIASDKLISLLIYRDKSEYTNNF